MEVVDALDSHPRAAFNMCRRQVVHLCLVSPVIESLLLSSSPVKDGACCRRCSAYFVLASACFDFLIDASRILLCAVRYCASRKVGHGTRSFSGRFMVTCCVVFHHSLPLIDAIAAIFNVRWFVGLCMWCMEGLIWHSQVFLKVFILA
ncbi:hypothetical protein TSUD_369400 [Trifolium subterraneum]|uniref:Uncharacterized protein n=1 Tax=Trifolium subterraneum TaxID=3900 RepID=A0A2Z6NXM1_TRISU|nr:hypothetical protein TSUD_369400 [Trifolium subterraneum]